MAATRAQGFTLFEVMISLVVISVAILASVLIIPIGLRAQSNARGTLYASAVAMTLMESFHNPIARVGGGYALGSNSRIAQHLRNNGIDSGPYQMDFERAVSRPYGGAIPLPLDISARIDADDGEIATVLANGGRLYYPDPSFVRSLQLNATRDSVLRSNELPLEFHKLVFAVVGSAQQNTLLHHPQEAWPIYELYPFPPNWLDFSHTQKRKGPNGLSAPYNNGAVMLGGNNTQMYGDGGLDSCGWSSDPSPSLAEAIDEASDPNNQGAGCTIGYHGRHWLRFRTQFPGSLWDAGWPAFQALAGDVKAGWLPVQGLLSIASTYKDAVSDPSHTMWPGKTYYLSTYEMRASYRDRAIRLWNAVKPASLPSIGALTPSLTVSDTQTETHQYEYGPDDLRTWIPSDPYALTGTSGFTPHPAQVFALSYLAHAAMQVTGVLPPWKATLYNADKSASLDQVFSPFWKDPNQADKDVLVVVDDAASGGTIVNLKAQDAARPILLYQLDYLWFENDPTMVYRVKAKQSGTGNVTVTLDKRYEVDGNGNVKNIDGASDKGDLLKKLVKDSRCLRVASDADRAFARKVHEMCLRWAMAYASENPYDWGAPRPSNRQTAMDKPLAIFDLWWDAANGTDSTLTGKAVRKMVKQYTEYESFYRWLTPINRLGLSNGAYYNLTPSNVITTPASKRENIISHLGPFNWPLNKETYKWVALQGELSVGRFKPPPPTDAKFLDADQERYWVNRPFAPIHRSRKLVFWSVDWKSYEDAETTMSATMDLASYGHGIAQSGGDWWIYGLSDFGGVEAGNPEGLYIWTDKTRRRRWCDDHTSDGAFYVKNEGDRDLILGHWGADRNNNGKLDIGPIPKTTRLRAVRLAEFNFYDPILRLRARD